MEKNTASNNAQAPFSDVSQQKSVLIQKIIEAVKEPLLAIYAIGVRKNCSHYKHVVRLCEYVLLAPKGKVLVFDFSPEKIEKTRKNFAVNEVSGNEKNAVQKWAAVATVNLDELDGKKADAHENFVFWFTTELIDAFAGGRNFETFHKKKTLLFELYNGVVSSTPVELKSAGRSAAEREGHYEPLKKVNIPVVVA